MPDGLGCGPEGRLPRLNWPAGAEMALLVGFTAEVLKTDGTDARLGILKLSFRANSGLACSIAFFSRPASGSKYPTRRISVK